MLMDRRDKKEDMEVHQGIPHRRHGLIVHRKGTVQARRLEAELVYIVQWRRIFIS